MRAWTAISILTALAGGIWLYGHTRYQAGAESRQPAIRALEAKIDAAGGALQKCDAATQQAKDEAAKQRARAADAVQAAEASAHKAAALNVEWQRRLQAARQDPACAEVLEMELCPAVMDY